jgi:Carbohydrate-selective porin, OprB family
MWRRFSVLSMAMPLLGLMVADAVCAADSPETERLQERIRVLEERLDRLDRVDVIKKTVEYVCPGGEIFDEAPPGGRCPDGSRPFLRDTVRKSTVARRESIGEKIEAAIVDADARKVAVGGAARGILQQVANAEEGQNQLFGEGSIDLTLLYHPMVRTTLFIDFEAIAGPGPDKKLGTLSRVNADAETLNAVGGFGGTDEKLTIREAWLWLKFVNDRLDFFIGQLDLTNYFDRNVFANDETTQFLNQALVNNAMLKQPVNGVGVTLRWDAGRDLGFSLGAQTTHVLDEDLWSEPFVIGEIDYHSTFLIEGNYRLWVRVTSRPPPNRQQQMYGGGISIDQLLTPQLGVFVRAGVNQIESISRTFFAASGGLRWTGPLWNRPRDRVGVGYNFQRDVPGDEQVTEVYYNLFLTDHFSVIGNVEWLIHGPNQVTGRTNNNVVIPGIRAVVVF